MSSYVISANIDERFTNFGASGAIVFGLLTWLLLSVVQFVGLARWPILVPFLARAYTDPGGPTRLAAREEPVGLK